MNPTERTESGVRAELVERTLAHVGYKDLHPDVSLNFQLNRWVQWLGDDTVLSDVRGVAPRISDYSDWRREFQALSERALAEGRGLHAAYYLRSAEFFMFPDDQQKDLARKRFLGLVRDIYGIASEEHYEVPYKNGYLPAYRFSAEVNQGTSMRGTVVIFGGFDSYVEEFFPMAFFFTGAGYEVVMFEGPGQGGALEDARLPMTHEWEKPTGAVLDYFGLQDVTLMGVSLGGNLAMRAAAYELRVKRVVADDVLTDFSEANFRQLGSVAGLILKGLLAGDAENVTNRIVRRAMLRSPVVNWGIRQGMNATGTTTPYGYLKETQRYTTADVSALVRSDVLVLAAAEDHYVPLGQFHRQLRLLTNARSLTGRIFTRSEEAHNHCHVGNLRLSLDYILGWIERATHERESVRRSH